MKVHNDYMKRSELKKGMQVVFREPQMPTQFALVEVIEPARIKIKLEGTKEFKIIDGVEQPLINDMIFPGVSSISKNMEKRQMSFDQIEEYKKAYM